MRRPVARANWTTRIRGLLFPWRGSYLFFREREDLRRGTFAPFFRASLRPMAIACFRLFTLRPEPLLRVPFFLRCIADLTRLPAALPYLAMSSIDANAVLSSLAGT